MWRMRLGLFRASLGSDGRGRPSPRESAPLPSSCLPQLKAPRRSCNLRRIWLWRTAIRVRRGLRGVENCLGASPRCGASSPAECGEFPPALPPAAARVRCSARWSRGLDEDRLAARTAPWTTPCTRRFCSTFTGITKRSPRMVTSSSCTVPPSERRAQISAQGILNGAPLLFDLAANAGEFRRGAVFEGAIGLNLVPEIAAKFLKVGDAGRELRDRLPIAAHGGGRMREICRHSEARSTMSRTSRISVVSRAAPAMRDLSSNTAMSIRAENSKRPPTRRNSRISVVRWCCSPIQSRSVVGASAARRCAPSGDEM